VGITYELYNAPEEQAKMSSWDKHYSEPLGVPNDMKRALRSKYPRLKEWEEYRYGADVDLVAAHSASGTDNCNPNNEYLDITLYEHQDGYIHSVRVTRGSPKLVGEVKDLFDIKYVYEAQSDQLLNPNDFKGNWEPI